MKVLYPASMSHQVNQNANISELLEESSLQRLLLDKHQCLLGAVCLFEQNFTTSLLTFPRHPTHQFTLLNMLICFKNEQSNKMNRTVLAINYVCTILNCDASVQLVLLSCTTFNNIRIPFSIFCNFYSSVESWTRLPHRHMLHPGKANRILFSAMAACT